MPIWYRLGERRILYVVLVEKFFVYRFGTASVREGFCMPFWWRKILYVVLVRKTNLYTALLPLW